MPRRPNLQGNKRPDGRWIIRITLTDSNGAKWPKDVYGRTQQEAQEKAYALLVDTGRRAPSSMTVGVLLSLYREDPFQDLEQKTRDGYEAPLRRIAARFKSEKVANILPFTVAAWLKQLREVGFKEKIKPGGGKKEIEVTTKILGSNQRLHKSVFSAVLAHGVAIGAIDSNPCGEFKASVRADKGKKVRPILTEAMLKAIVDKSPAPYNLLFETLAETGVRPDREGLRFERRHITYSDERFWLQVEDTKTAAGANRSVPISNELALKLLALPEGKLWNMNYRTVHDKWQAACAAAEVDYTNPYQLRKLAVTRWAKAKVSKAVAIALVGHTDSKLIEQVYTRITRADIAEGLKQVGL